jgi:hypothetical protein
MGPALALPLTGERNVKRKSQIMIASLCAAAATLAACGSSSNSGGSSYKTCGSATSGGGLLQPFTAPCTDQGSNAVLVTASGEVLALGGYNFPPASADAPAFVDGWEIRFSKMLVTFDHVKLSQNPDQSPTDESQTGALVAQEDGPWAVDLHKGGSLAGKGGSGEQAAPITAFVNQNKNGNATFDPTQRYAFGFDIVPATTSAKNVNLDTSSGSTDLQDYQEMITKGYTALFIGTATFRGTSCSSPSGSPTYDFTKLPTVVNFRLGFVSPTTYINCQNPDNDPATPLDGEEHERGVAVKSNATVIAQTTFHTDHPFWDSFVHDSPAHFDQIAAQYVGVAAPTATIEDMVSVKTFSTGFTDKNGASLPWRSCLSTYTPPDHLAMHFDVQGRTVNTSATAPGDYLRDYRDYMTFNESTFGHLNADGLCFVKRNYTSAN